jgi:hypothetical protein
VIFFFSFIIIILIFIAAEFVLHTGAKNLEYEEDDNHVDWAEYLKFAIIDKSKDVGIDAVMPQEEGETLNDHEGTNRYGSVSIHCIFLKILKQGYEWNNAQNNDHH